MELKAVRFEQRDDGIAVLTIDQPEKLNALSALVLEEIDECIRRAADERAIRGVIITGAGEKSFVAGADIRQFSTLDRESGRRFALAGQAIFSRIETLPKPVVAAVNGYALGGGCELAIACHLRIASENAIFGQPEVTLGILPGYGGTQRLPRLVGLGIATELILTGDRISAQRAYEIGLVNRVVPAAQLLEEAIKLVGMILSRAPLAVGMSLEALHAAHLPPSEGLPLEADLFGEACATEDFKEGVAAFLLRRKADFHGK